MNAATTPLFVGHDDALQQAKAALASGRMHHAWLIAGIEGIGKATLAQQIATHVLSAGNSSGRADVQHRIERLIAAESHPDLLVIRRAADEKTGEMRKVIVVDDALKVGAFLRKTATHGGWRVVIIDEAHALNRHAQNAILKILEEPPAHVLILMTVTTPGALLPTIRSRCRVLQLAPLDEAHMKAILARNAGEVTPVDLNRLVALSGGSAGFALKILRTETLPLYDELLQIIGAPNANMARVHKLADQIGRKADAESFDVIKTLLMDRLRASARDAALGGQQGLGHRLQLLDKVHATFALADSANLDRKLAFVNMIGEVCGAL